MKLVLKILLWTATFIILFYIEEDWRGARAWSATKEKWEAKGETFDFTRLIPRQVADDENLATLPLFKLEPNPEKDGDLEPAALMQFLKVKFTDQEQVYPGSWDYGELSDLNKIRASVAQAYLRVVKPAAPVADPLAQFDALHPFLADFRAASTARPYCLSNLDYQPRPETTPFMAAGAQIELSKLLTFRAVLALHQGRQDEALADIQTNFKILDGLQKQPIMMFGLLTSEIPYFNFSAIYDGLARHLWTDTQLAVLEKEFAKVDFLAGYQLLLRGGTYGDLIPFLDSVKTNRASLAQNLEDMQAQNKQKKNYFPQLWPNGWLDLAKADLVSFELSEANFADPAKRLVFPQVFTAYADAVNERKNRWDANMPWNIFFPDVLSLLGKRLIWFATDQVYTDQFRIACALERYHLAHGVYPDSLDALVPASIDALPHDIMSGQPYRYQLHPDGSFLLYSVGWNQIDNGGKVFNQATTPSSENHLQGDWVWPTPKAPTTP